MPWKRLRTVAVLAHPVLHLVWEDGAEGRVDLASILDEFEAYAALRDPAVFATAKVAAWGAAIEWSTGADISAWSLALLADRPAPPVGGP